MNGRTRARTPGLASCWAVVVALGIGSACLAAGGCGSSKGTTAPPQGTVQDLVNLIASLVPPEFVLPGNVDGSASVLATMDVESNVHAFAVFQNGSNLVDAGSVWVGGPSDPPPLEAMLDVRSTPVSGVSQFVYSTMPSHSSGITLAFDGAAHHHFRVTGSSRFPALADSVRSVTAIAPTSPASGATVPRSQALLVQWSDAGSDTTVYVTAMVYRTANPAQRRLSGVVRDGDGQLSISSATLSALPAGGTTLVVVRYRLRTFTMGAAFPVAVLVEAGDARPITLQ